MVIVLFALVFLLPLPALADDPFDPVIAGSIFAVFFAGVVGSYLLSKSIGLIIEAIKKW